MNRNRKYISHMLHQDNLGTYYNMIRIKKILGLEETSREWKYYPCDKNLSKSSQSQLHARR